MQREHNYGQPSEQLFPKRWSLSNLNRTANKLHKHKVKRQRNWHQKQVTENHNITTALEQSVINYWGEG